MALKSTPGERANRLVNIGENMTLSFGSGALGSLAAFCQRHIHSGTAVGFTLGHDKKKVKFALSLALPTRRGKHSCSNVEPSISKLFHSSHSTNIPFSLGTRYRTGAEGAAEKRNTNFCHLRAYILLIVGEDI